MMHAAVAVRSVRLSTMLSGPRRYRAARRKRGWDVINSNAFQSQASKVPCRKSTRELPLSPVCQILSHRGNKCNLFEYGRCRRYGRCLPMEPMVVQIRKLPEHPHNASCACFGSSVRVIGNVVYGRILEVSVRSREEPNATIWHEKTLAASSVKLSSAWTSPRRFTAGLHNKNTDGVIYMGHGK